MSDKYSDIIDLPHHSSEDRPHMSMHDRAAQFAPYAALVGYGDAVAETGRLTDVWTELEEDPRTEIDRVIIQIRNSAEDAPRVRVTYFVPDSLKDGGAYRTVTGSVKKIDDVKREIVLAEGIRIPVDSVQEMEMQ